MGRSPEIWAYKCLRTKYFHGVSSGNQHLYLLKSRYGKVRVVLPPEKFHGTFPTSVNSRLTKSGGKRIKPHQIIYTGANPANTLWLFRAFGDASLAGL